MDPYRVRIKICCIQSSDEARTAASPSPLLRWYIDGPFGSAPSALMCR